MSTATATAPAKAPTEMAHWVVPLAVLALPRWRLLLGGRCDRKGRKGTGPSDHAPVIVDLDEAPDGDLGPVVPPPSLGAKRPPRRR